ncbi:hypothetical protein NMD1_03383 [Novosphingobium sp. MD-1]|nr:hypothetical protein NMD1_03383 [Novosphingobium sp. MD-1]
MAEAARLVQIRVPRACAFHHGARTAPGRLWIWTACASDCTILC